MRWKLALAVLLVVAIATLLFFSESSIPYLDFLKKKVGDFVDIVFRWVPGGKQFFITLKSDKEIFYGQTYKISNSTFDGSGTVKELKINKAVVPLTQADIKIEGMKGSFEITRQDSVKISADADRVFGIAINNLPILNLNIYVEMAPSTFSLSQFNQDKLTFSSVDGQVKTEEGWTKELGNADVEIYGFKGSLKFEGDQVVLEGLTSKLVVDGKEVTITSK
jgi:hypothetical protein